MHGLSRYILRQSLGTTLFVTAALSAAIWLTQSLRLVDLIVNRGLSAELFFYLGLLIVPRFVDIVLPIGIFIAVLFTYNKLIAESEIVVMRAAGVSQATGWVIIDVGFRLSCPSTQSKKGPELPIAHARQISVLVAFSLASTSTRY